MNLDLCSLCITNKVLVLCTYILYFALHSHSESPSAPVNVTISNMTNTSATLSWLPPEYSGGRNISEITYNITYSGVYEWDSLFIKYCYVCFIPYIATCAFEHVLVEFQLPLLY